jgi:hypothetical protein
MAERIGIRVTGQSTDPDGWGKGYLVEGVESPDYEGLAPVGDALIQMITQSEKGGQS